MDIDEEARIVESNKQSLEKSIQNDAKPLEETTYLLHSPKNRQRLIAAIKSFAKDIGQECFLGS